MGFLAPLTRNGHRLLHDWMLLPSDPQKMVKYNLRLVAVVHTKKDGDFSQHKNTKSSDKNTICVDGLWDKKYNLFNPVEVHD